MIKGTKLTPKKRQRNQKSSEAFLDFIYFVENTHLLIGGTQQEPIYKFNGFETPEAFEYRLIQLYEENTEKIRSLVRDIEYKADKLDELNFYIDELELLADNCIQDGMNFNHSKFKIGRKPVSIDFDAFLTSSLVQDCLQNIKEYTYRLLQDFKNLRGDIRSTSQSDFILPEYLQPKLYDSSPAYPFRYFVYLIDENGILDLKCKLMTLPDDDDQRHMIIDRTRELITYYRYEEGEEKEYVKNVSDLVEKEIKVQSKQTKQLLKKAISHFASLNDAQEFFKIQIPELKRLFNSVSNRNPANKVLKEQLITIAVFILNQFEEFLQKRPKNILRNIIGFKTQMIKATDVKRYSYAFDLKNITLDKLMVLASIHLKSAYIREEDLPLFKNIFTGGTPEKKIVKICWQGKYNCKTSKQSLIYLFDALQKAEMIVSIAQAELIDKITKLFCDAEGISLEDSIRSNFYQFNKSKGNHPKIDHLIQLLKS